ncbi:FHA domain-containing protein [Azotobacter beijerinckii]|uniref:FHA domain-containing protein n=1 Tax=Azotobacter beijerinckii TaxID=170623 RepID=A0A1I4CSZ7_9GAMM|nr:FHA domain-containing protein [Azotobacter beijerinckii]SFB24847.1 FHA domain-containing protein [Azotobacter beijerinckii]SFK83419.1 FHA domain-containing protein [Azotobacter beijerinckii]
MLKLNFKDSRQAPIWLVEERFTIGRDRRNRLVLDDSGVSDFHAEIRQRNGLYYLHDCESENGTFVNDARIASHYQLRADDLLRVGPVELLLLDPSKAKPRAEAAPRWFLQVIQGEHEGRKFHVQGSMTFGRSAKCELCFGDPELSRRHGEFFLKGDVLEIKDLASANGVYVNRRRIDSAVLQPGDQVRMGSVTLLVIGPRVEVPQAEDEDATLFMAAVDLSRPEKPGTSGRAPVANPLHAAAQAVAACPPEAKAGASRLVLGLLAAGALLAAAVLVAVFR